MSGSWTVRGISGLAMMTLLPALLQAQDEAHLRKAFEGKRVTVKIDMPASSEGVDLFPGTNRPLDFQKLAGRLKKWGTAIKPGDQIMITKVKVKDDLVEIHLGGGGYGTFGDVFGAALKNNGSDSGAAQQAKFANERTERLASGSRFNLRWANGSTLDDLMPEAIAQALAEYAEFPAGSLGPTAGRDRAAPAPTPTGPAVTYTSASSTAPVPGGAAGGATAAPPSVTKGMSVDDVERLLGKVSSSSTSGPVVTNVYSSATGVTEVDLVNGVAVAVRQRAAGPAPSGGVRKGMSLEDVERVAGKPLSSETKGPITTHKYRWQDGTLEGDFVNGVLVGYRIVAN